MITDAIAEFLDDSIKAGLVISVTPNGRFSDFILVGDLYPYYTHYSAAAGLTYPTGKKTFSRTIGRTYPQIRSNGVRFRGLIASPPDTATTAFDQVIKRA